MWSNSVANVSTIIQSASELLESTPERGRGRGWTRGMNQTAPNLGRRELHYSCTKAIVWCLYVTSCRNKGGSKASYVKSRGQISHCLPPPPCKIIWNASNALKDDTEAAETALFGNEFQAIECLWIVAVDRLLGDSRHAFWCLQRDWYHDVGLITVYDKNDKHTTSVHWPTYSRCHLFKESACFVHRIKFLVVLWYRPTLFSGRIEYFFGPTIVPQYHKYNGIGYYLTVLSNQ